MKEIDFVKLKETIESKELKDNICGLEQITRKYINHFIKKTDSYLQKILPMIPQDDIGFEKMIREIKRLSGSKPNLKKRIFLPKPYLGKNKTELEKLLRDIIYGDFYGLVNGRFKVPDGELALMLLLLKDGWTKIKQQLV